MKMTPGGNTARGGDLSKVTLTLQIVFLFSLITSTVSNEGELKIKLSREYMSKNQKRRRFCKSDAEVQAL